MAKTPSVPAAEFTRNFGRYRMVAQRGAVPVTSHGQIAGYFVPPDEYEEFERFQARRRSFATAELPTETVKIIEAVRMDPRHDQLNALMDEE